MPFHVQDSSQVFTVGGGTRFVRASATVRALLRASLVNVASVDVNPVAPDHVATFALVWALTGELRAVGSPESDGRQVFDLFDAQGNALLRANGSPVTCTLPTVEVSSLVLSVNAAPHDGWFRHADGWHRRGTLVTTETHWSNLLGQASLPATTRRTTSLPLTSLASLANALETASFMVTHNGFDTVTGRPRFALGATTFTVLDPYATLNEVRFPHPRELANPMIIEAENPVTSNPPAIGTPFKVVILA